MIRVLSILIITLIVGCGSSDETAVEKVTSKSVLSMDVNKIELVDPKDGYGIMNAKLHGKPYNGVVENFQGYLVADYIKESKDSLRFTSGFSYYTNGKLDSVVIPFLNERRYFNQDNTMDSIYTENAILHFKDEILIRMIER